MFEVMLVQNQTMAAFSQLTINHEPLVSGPARGVAQIMCLRLKQGESLCIAVHSV